MAIPRRTLFAAAASLGLAPSALRAAPRIGAPAPDFTGIDSNGQAVRLSDLRGRVVVLEWTNDGCPFVQKWYRTGAMQALQRDAAGLGAVWLSVISSAPGEQGGVDGPRANELTRTRNAAPARVLLDRSGAIGHLYDAQTTPHVFVIGKNGMLGYMGGADGIASTRDADLGRVTPCTQDALTAIVARRPAPAAVTRPHGCTVKYAV